MPRTRDISNSDDLIDSRDVIKRIAELEDSEDDDEKAELATLLAPKLCNAQATWQASNGYRVCPDCYLLESDTRLFTHASEYGPEGCLGRCDRPTDGLGAMSMSRRRALRPDLYAVSPASQRAQDHADTMRGAK